MRPKKKRVGREQPDAVVDEIPDTLGGTDGDESGDDEDRAKAEVGRGGDYGRSREQGEGEDPF